MRQRSERERRRERGAVMVFAALAATALLLFAALTIDVGIVWSSRTQSQSAGDAAVLAAAANLIDPNGALDLAGATAAAIALAAANSTVGNPSVNLGDGDITFGHWDLCGSPPTLDTGVDITDPDLVTAVRVDVHMDGTTNKQSPVFLSQLIGRNGFVVSSSSVAYLGFEGSSPPFDLDLPLAVCDTSDCCADDFCKTYADPLANPPNACLGDVTLSCLDPSASNPLACLTAFGDAVNTTTLMNLINNGNPNPLGVGDLINVDPGGPGVVDEDVLQALQDKLTGSGGTWVAKLPVVDCQGGTPCTSGSLPIRGSVCFEIQQVVNPGPPPSLDIRGRFLCSDSPKFAACRDASGPPHETGGCNYGLRSVQAVLVN